MGLLTVAGTGAEEICHTLAEGTRVIDSRRHHLCILQETMTGALLIYLAAVIRLKLLTITINSSK